MEKNGDHFGAGIIESCTNHTRSIKKKDFIGSRFNFKVDTLKRTESVKIGEV